MRVRRWIAASLAVAFAAACATFSAPDEPPISTGDADVDAAAPTRPPPPPPPPQGGDAALDASGLETCVGETIIDTDLTNLAGLTPKTSSNGGTSLDTTTFHSPNASLHTQIVNGIKPDFYFVTIPTRDLGAQYCIALTFWTFYGMVPTGGTIDGPRLVGQAPDGGKGGTLSFELDTQGRYKIGDNGPEIVIADALTIGKWHEVAMVVHRTNAGMTYTVTLDQTTAPANNASELLDDAAVDLQIGIASFAPNATGDVYVDDVRLVASAIK
jgi:hypothetical protein